jgi:hypothetical protein
MDLPLRISRAPQSERVISVDGAWGAPGLNLSHWPGNTTPSELKHDLSTGIALAFARLDDARRRELARGCTAIVNNHYDTDGTCALFAVTRPREALQREAALLEAAAAGDLFQFPSERALRVDLIVSNLCDAQSSPIAREIANLDDYARYEVATRFLLEQLPAILDGDAMQYRDIWEPELVATRADVSDLRQCERDDVVHLDWTIWNAKPALFRRGAGESHSDAGRHALFGSTPHDRVLFVQPRDGGTCYRLVLSSLSWFELVTREAHPRPDLAALAQRLNELEGTDAGATHAWRHQETQSASPELWFGERELEMFAERCDALRPSALSPALVRRTIADSMRAALALPA